MSDYNKLILGEDDSQTAPVCNGTVREMLAEIDRIKAELEEAYTELAISIKERIDLGNQLAEVITEKEAAISLVHDYKAQLAEARAEVESLKEEIHHYEDQGLWMPDKEDLVRKRAAREIIQYIEDQGMIDIGGRKPWIYEICNEDIIELKQRFGLEG